MNINLVALQDGLVVLSVGFFVVFMFLTIMIFAMGIMAKIVAWLNKVFPVASAAAATTKAKTSSSAQDEEIAVAIACALLKQRA